MACGRRSRWLRRGGGAVRGGLVGAGARAGEGEKRFCPVVVEVALQASAFWCQVELAQPFEC